MSRPATGRGLAGRALLCLAVLAASTYLLLTTAPRLGLDLRGGTQIVAETRDSPTTKADQAATDRTLEVLRGRIDDLGVAEPMLARSGERRIVIELPDVQDPAEALAAIGRTAQLSFHPVLGVEPHDQPPATTDPAPDGTRVLPDERGQPIRIGPAALDGDGVDRAARSPDPRGAGWLVSVEFGGGASRAWERLTAEAACAAAGDPARRVAILLDDEVISSPQVDPGVACGAGILGGRTDITGRFSAAEADQLARLINAGALPVPVEVVEQRTIGATLGDDAVAASAAAAAIGLALTALFLLVVYRLAGLVAVLSLVCYAGISYAALLAVGATLTLPGLAGFVLAIGMAVDATVLVFERAREEHRARPDGQLGTAIERGFRGALPAILDSNVTTLLAAGLLFWLASGPVRGFGVTLTIGVLASMFTALVLTRVLLRLTMRGWPAGRPRLTGLDQDGRVRRWVSGRGPGFLARPRRFLAAAGLAAGIAMAGLVVAGPNLGVEFTGGRALEYRTAAAVDVDRVRDAVAGAGFPRAVVQQTGDRTVSVRTEPVSQRDAMLIDDAVAGAADAAGDTGTVTKLRDEKIGPSLGAELRNKALLALGLAVAAQLVYLAVRFDWRLGVATVVALCQDVLLVLGSFAWLGLTFDGVFLAALLTVIGHSVNDSVVVFDRVRELRVRRRGEPFHRVVGAAVLQTLPRTVHTGVGVLLVLGALLLLSEGALADFSLALVLGLVFGTVSTVVTAAPVAILLDQRRPVARRRPPRRHGRRPVRTGRRADHGAVV